MKAQLGSPMPGRRSVPPGCPIHGPFGPDGSPLPAQGQPEEGVPLGQDGLPLITVTDANKEAAKSKPKLDKHKKKSEPKVEESGSKVTEPKESGSKVAEPKESESKVAEPKESGSKAEEPKESEPKADENENSESIYFYYSTPTSTKSTTSTSRSEAEMQFAPAPVPTGPTPSEREGLRRTSQQDNAPVPTGPLLVKRVQAVRAAGGSAPLHEATRERAGAKARTSAPVRRKTRHTESLEEDRDRSCESSLASWRLRNDIHQTAGTTSRQPRDRYQNHLARMADDNSVARIRFDSDDEGDDVSKKTPRQINQTPDSHQSRQTRDPHQNHLARMVDDDSVARIRFDSDDDNDDVTKKTPHRRRRARTFSDRSRDECRLTKRGDDQDDDDATKRDEGAWARPLAPLELPLPRTDKVSAPLKKPPKHKHRPLTVG